MALGFKGNWKCGMWRCKRRDEMWVSQSCVDPALLACPTPALGSWLLGLRTSCPPGG